MGGSDKEARKKTVAAIHRESETCVKYETFRKHVQAGLRFLSLAAGGKLCILPFLLCFLMSHFRFYIPDSCDRCTGP